MTATVRLKSVVLPAEHGSWGLVLEPLLLGLLVAPSLAGACLALAAFFAFMAHQPFSVVWLDARRGRRFARTSVALRFLLLFGALALGCGLLALWLAPPTWLLPLLLSLPFVLLFVAYDLRPGRHWQAESAAPVGFAAVAAAIPLAAGWPLLASLALWAVMAARGVPSVVYVRARVRLIKNKPVSRWPTWMAHAVALLLVGGLIAGGWLPISAEIGMLLLFLRAAVGLSRWRRPLSFQQLGFLEMGFGLMVVLAVAVGIWLG